DGDAREAVENDDLARPLAPQRGRVQDPGEHRAAEEQERAGDVEDQQPVVAIHATTLRPRADEERVRSVSTDPEVGTANGALGGRPRATPSPAHRDDR